MGTVSDRTWSEILASLRSRHPELIRPWFTRLDPIDLQHGVIRIRTDDYAHYQYLSQQCQAPLTEAAQAITGRLVTVAFLPPPAPSNTDLPLSFEAETEHLRLNPDYTFDNFVTGPCNQLAHAACVAV